MLRARRLPALVAVLALGVAPLAACGQSAEKKAVEALIKNSDDSVKSVDIDGDAFSIETDEGTFSMGEGAAVPDEFPSDVPMPAVDHTVVTASVSGGRVTLMLSAPDLDVTAEAARLLSGLESAGWTIGDKTEMNTADTKMYALSATKGTQELGINLVREAGDDGSLIYSVEGGQ